jgi:poly(A) polymerase
VNITPLPWMTTPQVKTLLSAIPQAESSIRFVGGCVRDALLGLPVQDIDLATVYQPQEIINFLQNNGLKVFPIGLSHGTVLAVVDGIPYEITTLRKDVETDGRHAKVEFTDDWLEDAKRRDFTFNALYLTPQGELYDPWQGYEDLKAGKIHFIGEAHDRIQEDYLRILRFFRFYARFAKQAPDPTTLSALTDLAPGLKKISGERIHHELFRLLAHPTPHKAFQLMAETSVLNVCFGLPHVCEKFHELLELEKALVIAPSVLRRFFALFWDDVSLLKKAENRLKLSHKEKTHLHSIRQALNLNTKSDNWLLYHYGADIFKDVRLLLASQKEDLIQEQLKRADDWIPKKMPVTGHDLLQAGIKEGPSLGVAMTHLEEWWIANDFLPEKEECLGRLAYYRAGML